MPFRALYNMLQTKNKQKKNIIPFKINVKVIKKIVIISWLILLVLMWGYYLINPAYFSAKNIAHVLSKYEGYLFVVYAVISALRGLTLLPNMTLIIAGTLMFPNNLTMLLIISVFGITASSVSIYYFSEFLGFDKFFVKKYPKKIEYIKQKMNKHGIIILLLWSFLPIVPSDLISYVSGTLQFSIVKFVGAIIVGHLIIYLVVIFCSDSIFNFFI